MGNVLYSGTLQHVRKAALATTFISSHDLDNILPLKGFELDNFTSGRRVFLQHGVLGRKSVEYDKKYYHHPFDLFCVSSEPEKKLVEKNMGYAPDEVKITGLSRFDHLLKRKKQRQSILLIPTWRDWFSSYSSFKKSSYFNKYQSLLKNDKLHHLLEKHDLTMDFYLHYRMHPFISDFKSFGSDRINIVRFDEKNVQTLLIENRLLITDYSSVSFDFNYMSKPVVFYHFDVPLFFKRGILRPISETFLGDICHKENQLVQAIEKYINNGFKEDPKIAEKKGAIFSHIDTNNNQRIYNEITKINKNSEKLG